MPKSRSAFSRFSIPLIAYLLLLLPVSVYYFFYTQSKKEYFTARNFRQLSVMSEQIDFTLRNYNKIFQNALHDGNDPKRYLQKFVKELRNVKIQAAPPGTGSPRFTVNFVDGDGSWRVLLDYVAPQHAMSITAERDIREMLDRFPGSEVFDDVLLANRSGAIVYQGRKSGLRFTSLDGLRSSAGQSRWLPFFRTPSAATAPKAGEPAEELHGASRLISGVELSGKSYEIYLQPLPVPYAAADGKSVEWTLCAMVRTRRLLSESLAISYDLILWFVSVSLLMLMTLPFLRFRSLTGWEALRYRHVLALFLCSCCFASIFVLSALHIYHFEIREHSDGQLEYIANRANIAIRDELRQISRQLRQFCQSPALWNQIAAHSDYRQGPEWSLGKAPPENHQEWRPRIRPQAYEHLKFAVWADSAGWQWIKWDVRERVTPFINIDERLTGIKQGRSWRLAPGYGGEQFLPYRLELVFSQNTGEYIANYVVRTRQCISPPDRSDEAALKLYRSLEKDPLVANGYAYIATELHSVVNPLLPPDTGFALVDQSGTTIIHSNPSRNQRENFFIESDEDDRLRAAVFSQSSTFMKIRYLGRDHDAYVTRLTDVPDVPYSLIVFRDLANVETMHIETQTLAAFLLLPYLGILAFVTILRLAVASSKYPANWIWPDENIGERYRAVSVLCIALLVLAGVWIVAARSSEMYFSVVVIGSSAGILGTAVLKSGRPDMVKTRGLWIITPSAALIAFAFIGWRSALLLPLGLAAMFVICTSRQVHDLISRPWRLSFAGTYALSAALLITVVGVVPCIACFKIAHDLESELLIRSAQTTLARSIVERIAEARRQYDETASARPFNPAEAFGQDYLGRFHGAKLYLASSPYASEFSDSSSTFKRFLANARIAYNKGVSQTSAIPLSRKASQWTWLQGDWPTLRYRTRRLDASPEGGLIPADADSDVVLLDSELRPLAHFASLASAKESAPEVIFWILLTGAVTAALFVVMRRFTSKVSLAEMVMLPVRVPEAMAARAGVVVASGPPGSPDPNNWPATLAIFKTAVSRNRHSIELVEIFERECSSRGDLLRIAREIAGDKDLEAVTPVALTYRILAAAEPHYETKWKALSTRERFVLYHLALDGLVNPVNASALLALIREGLIVSRPRFEIFNESFRLFILDHVLPSEMTVWASERARKGSNSIRMTLLLLVLAAIAFLFLTRPELVHTSVGFLTALAAAIGAVMKFLPSEAPDTGAKEK